MIYNIRPEEDRRKLICGFEQGRWKLFKKDLSTCCDNVQSLDFRRVFPHFTSIHHFAIMDNVLLKFGKKKMFNAFLCVCVSRNEERWAG